ncbi:MAG: hypothetical protein LUD79_01405 [Oscillospiraceae bacterium]|nr:hypothetical protein [Oscillospiraceae bacterium]
MIESDTIKLLRECNAGVKMGVQSIQEAIPSVESQYLRGLLETNMEAHNRLGDEARELLNRYDDSGKEPNPMAKGMSWMMTNVKLAMNPGDGTVANLITDGCNMGVKSLSKYLNQYAAASEEAKDVTKRLIRLEETLSVDVRGFLS